MKNVNAQLAAQVSPVHPNTNESAEQRVRRLYAHQGGPLIGWLLDEARRRGIELQQMAAELGVTYGYVHQLRTGIRKTSSISKDFATACGAFLGAPTCVVLLLAGFLTMRDFAVRALSEEEVIEKAVRQMLDDSHVRSFLAVDVASLPLDAKRALVAMYAEVTGTDMFEWRELPNMLRWLQRAALVHDENEACVIRGERDVLDRGE
ncbi:hypothetical protein HHL11_19435 [Ramlibacter sp. G-1-2-2]|uniref:Uncharacterized protein n=1 Tax=Ramlibacter agri TaxID=2728837 RepID=A0A848H8Y7_9BURK|nr:hypothetical protein [Ramlibacter agri]NML45931.1 hypothetical protein [Ramlibacter agri]